MTYSYTYSPQSPTTKTEVRSKIRKKSLTTRGMLHIHFKKGKEKDDKEQSNLPMIACKLLFSDCFLFSSTRQDYFTGTVRVPELEGMMHIREKPKSWKKLLCIIRSSGLYFSKTKSKVRQTTRSDGASAIYSRLQGVTRLPLGQVWQNSAEVGWTARFRLYPPPLSLSLSLSLLSLSLSLSLSLPSLSLSLSFSPPPLSLHFSLSSLSFSLSFSK